MQTRTKSLFDEKGNLIIRPYFLMDLAALYGVSGRTMRRWIDAKAPQYAKKNSKYFTVEQVQGIINALGIPQKIAVVVNMPQLKQAV